MKVIFLDIDGVLVTLDSFRVKGPRFRGRAEIACVEALNRILKETCAQIVVSSAWRAPRKLGWLRKKFAEWGIHAAKSRTIGMTPDLGYGIERGEEIRAWLNEHPLTDTFVILDDDSDMNGLSKFLVQTEFKKGLTARHANQAIAILNGPQG